MWFYILFITTIALCLNAYAKTKNIFYNNVLVLLVTIVAVLRYDVGYDYKTYHQIISNENHELIYLLFSPLSALFAEIAVYFKSPQLLFVLFGIPTYVLFLSALRRNSLIYSVSVIMFICLCYFNTLSIIRQALAVAITFSGYNYVKERKFFRYLIIVVSASLFHSSAIIALVIYWLPRFQFNKLLLGLVALIAFKPFVISAMKSLGFYDNYLSSDVHIAGGSLIIIFTFTLYAFCLYLWLQRRDMNNRGLINIVTIGMLCYVLFGPHLGGRASMYFEIYLYLLLPNLVSRLSIYSKKNVIVFASYSFVCFFLLYLWMPFLKGNVSSYIPYKIFLFQ